MANESNFASGGTKGDVSNVVYIEVLSGTDPETLSGNCTYCEHKGSCNLRAEYENEQDVNSVCSDWLWRGHDGSIRP